MLPEAWQDIFLGQFERSVAVSTANSLHSRENALQATLSISAEQGAARCC